MNEELVRTLGHALEEVMSAALYAARPMVVKEIAVDSAGHIVLGFVPDGAPDYEPLRHTEVHG